MIWSWKTRRLMRLLRELVAMKYTCHKKLEHYQDRTEFDMTMTKQELLKQIHETIWRDNDSMEQDTLSQLQGLIDCAIIEEAKQGAMIIKQFNNGFINSIEILVK